LPLTDLQFWNCMDYGVVSVIKQFTASMSYEARLKSGGSMRGTYVCTLDNYHPAPDTIDYSTSETPSEHKSMNIVELENGQYCAYPNNRLRIIDTSLSPKQLLVPDFKCSTQFFAVENETDAKTYGDSDAYYY
jgi:hypothetical protein